MNEITLARFLSKVNKDGPVPAHRPELGKCWLWIPLAGMGGYGPFYMDGRGQPAHRASYQLFIGPIPDGLVIDHLCRMRPCVNPAHLEAVTSGENTRRAKAWVHGAAWQKAKTHCPQGHPYDEVNTRYGKDGRRSCKACQARIMSERRARLRTENPPQPKQPREACRKGHAYAEFGVVRAGKRVCTECARENLRTYRDRRRAERSHVEKVTCKNGHPWIPENITLNKRGHKFCRLCRNERSAERYLLVKARRAVRTRPVRETCGNGHPWSGDNLYVLADGQEKCRACARDRNLAYRKRQKAALPAAAPKPPRTHCSHGHELAGDNLYVAPNGRKFCRACTAEYQRRQREGTASPSPGKRGPQRGKDSCPQGHPYDEENTYVPPSGGRKCRECIHTRTREFMRRKYAARKAAVAA